MLSSVLFEMRERGIDTRDFFSCGVGLGRSNAESDYRDELSRQAARKLYLVGVPDDCWCYS
jgi:hypothetical protein